MPSRFDSPNPGKWAGSPRPCGRGEPAPYFCILKDIDPLWRYFVEPFVSGRDAELGYHRGNDQEAAKD